jgi:hypothetical protein
MSEALTGAGRLAPEDLKLVTLARATRVRNRAVEGAAVRDLDGRTYAAASVALPSLSLSAIQVCVAMAVSSGAKGLEAAVLLADGDDITSVDLAAIRDLAGDGVPLHRGSAAGVVSGYATT